MKDQTTNDLRRILFDEIKTLRTGKTTAGQATAVSKLATNIINSASLEITAARAVTMIETKEDRTLNLEPMKLVSE